MQQMFSVRAVAVALVLTLGACDARDPASTASQQQLKTASTDPLEGFDAWVEKARQDWHIPGLSVAIVKDGKTIFAKGFGVKNINTKEPMTADTVSLIASTSKAFTSMSLAMLVDEGRLNWSDKVIEHLPSFRVKDPFVTAELTIGDLLTHNAGFEANNTPWVRGLSTDETLARMKDLPQANSLRSRYQYNNLAYLVAGEVVEAVVDMPLGDFVKTRIWQPLGMTSSYYDWDQDIKDNPHRTSAHLKGPDGQPYLTPYDSIEEAGGAGMFNSTVEDHAKWLQFLLARGHWQGQQLVSEERFDEIFTPRVVFSGPSYPAGGLTDSTFFTYGYGWFMQSFEGRKMMMHTGSMNGLNAINAIMPDEGVAMVALFNRGSSELRHALMYEIMDRFTDGHSDIKWSDETLAIYQERWAKGEDRYHAFLDHPADDAPASLPLNAYVGTYSNPVDGDVTVRLEKGQLMVDMPPKLFYRLKHHHHDTFLAYSVNQKEPRYYQTRVQFDMNISGQVPSMTIRGDSFKRTK